MSNPKCPFQCKSCPMQKATKAPVPFACLLEISTVTVKVIGTSYESVSLPQGSKIYCTKERKAGSRAQTQQMAHDAHSNKMELSTEHVKAAPSNKWSFISRKSVSPYLTDSKIHKSNVTSPP